MEPLDRSVGIPTLRGPFPLVRRPERPEVDVEIAEARVGDELDRVGPLRLRPRDLLHGDEAARLGGGEQRVAEVGMGDADQRQRALADRPARVVTTPAPSVRVGTMRESVPSFAVDGSAMMLRPPSDRAAPRMKSTWPPTPL